MGRAARVGGVRSGRLGYGRYVVPFVIAGVGISMAIPTVPTAALSAVSAADVGRASGVSNTMQRFGAAFGIALVSAVFAAHGHLGSVGLVHRRLPAGHARLGRAVAARRGRRHAIGARRPGPLGQPQITGSDIRDLAADQQAAAS